MDGCIYQIIPLQSLISIMLQIAGLEKLMVNRDQELRSVNTKLATEKGNHESQTQLLDKAQNEIHTLKASGSQSSDDSSF